MPKKRARNQAALMNMESKRMMLKEATGLIDALSVRLSTLATYALDERPDQALALVASDYDNLRSLLYEASQASLTIKRQLHDLTDQPDFSAPLAIVRDWIIWDADNTPRWRKAGRKVLVWLGAPRRRWKRWRDAAKERRKELWLEARKAEHAATSEESVDVPHVDVVEEDV